MEIMEQVLAERDMAEIIESNDENKIEEVHVPMITITQGANHLKELMQLFDG